MAWIESHTVLIRHRKLRDLARDLRIRPSYAMGHLHSLWHAALEQREDGDLSDWSDEFIAESSDFPGDAPQFVRLLQQHRWLDGKIIHDWVDYAGLYLTRKYSTSNPKLLKEIWAKHGRGYGASKKRTVSERIANIPNQPNQPDLNLPTKDPPYPPGGLGGRLSKLFHRKATTALSENELKSLKKVQKLKPSEDEIVLIEKFYTAEIPIGDWRRRDLATLLNNWNGEVDKARGWENGSHVPANNIPPNIQIRSLQQEIDAHPANSESVFHNPKCSDELRAELRMKRARIAELHKLVANGGASL